MDLKKTARGIFEHYREIYPEVKHYYGIIACYGLTLFCEQNPQDASLKKLHHDVLSRFPDNIDHPDYNFPSYRIGGIATARSVYKGLLTGAEYRERLQTYAEELMHARRSPDGFVSMPYEGGENKVWIDVASAATPFLLYSGLVLQNRQYLDEAVFQTLAMYKVFLDPSCGLLHQSRGFCGAGQLSEDHWSRGNGWGVFPLAELCADLPDDHPQKENCIRQFRAHVEALCACRTSDGLWRQELVLDHLGELDSYRETSGSGLILYAIGRGIHTGILPREPYLAVLRQGVRSLVDYAVGEDGSIHHSCPGCLCPGDGSVFYYLSKRPFPDEPHGAGPVLMALAAAQLCGLEDL